VLKLVGIMCWARRVIQGLWPLELKPCSVCQARVFYRCEQFLVTWLRGIEPKLAWPDIQRHWSSRVLGYRVPPDTQVCLKPRQAKCSFVTRHMAWLLPLAKLCDLRFWMLIKSCVPPSLFSIKCLGCKMLQSSGPAMRSLSQLMW
jgi:hypothetical protein